ncbi:DUF4345 domain-containing protein [Planomonospora parontospora]|uniref:DUF4345 domain-containing protein n=1 Tax=Planomonospora parontospora TaxID=58119 RepID=UPI00166F9BDE|nr:DUF4345 domain-containing protein [Planomonospora parontospora]GGL39495.1 hypothetical protein GCM10014719_45700 [Planomonospora parontospora subsp. antibiotica]GII18136.1 hypothetical protein Ppa05_48620 [Planomonospora parontospora subsp. antibiotica]
MRNTRFATFTLFASGLVVFLIGAATLLAPAALHGLNGIELGVEPGLLSEVRAAGGALLASGVLIGLGAFVPRLAFTAALLGTVTYLAYGLSRVLSIAVDGMPGSGLVLAAAVETALGLACALVLARRRRGGSDPRPAPDAAAPPTPAHPG